MRSLPIFTLAAGLLCATAALAQGPVPPQQTAPDANPGSAPNQAPPPAKTFHSRLPNGQIVYSNGDAGPATGTPTPAYVVDPATGAMVDPGTGQQIQNMTPQQRDAAARAQAGVNAQSPTMATPQSTSPTAPAPGAPAAPGSGIVPGTARNQTRSGQARSAPTTVQPGTGTVAQPGTGTVVQPAPAPAAPRP
jgi:hypothetical protein